MPFYIPIPPSFWPFGPRHGHGHGHARGPMPPVPVIPSSIGTTATSHSASSQRTRTFSTPGRSPDDTHRHHHHHHHHKPAQPEMKELGARNVTIIPPHPHTHHGHIHHPRSRSVPRPPTEAHIQAYAQQQAYTQQQREQNQARAQRATDTRSRLAQPSPNAPLLVPPARSQGHRSRSQSASINAHLMQGFRTHISQGTRPYLHNNHDLDAGRTGPEGDSSRNGEDPSNSMPSLIADSNSSRVGRSHTLDEPAASTRPSGNTTTGSVPLTTRLRYAIHRTDSGSRQIRAQSVDGTGSGGRATRPSTAESAAVPESAPYVPHAPEALDTVHGRGRTRSSMIHVVNRILPHSAQGTGATPGPAPVIPHHHPHRHTHHTHSLPPPPPHLQQQPHHHHHTHTHQHHQHHHQQLPPSHIAAITSQVPQTPYVPPAPEAFGPKPARRLRHHVSFANPNQPKFLHMHPIFATSSSNSVAPILYDAARSPSRTSVRCKFNGVSSETSGTTTPVPRMKENGEAVPAHVLAEPATDPPTSGKLVLRCDRFPWEVIVTAGCAGSSSTPSSTRPQVTNNDVLHAVYHTLRAPVLHSEWNTLDSDRSTQRRVSRAYQRRVEMMQLRASRDRAQASLVAGRRVSGGGEETGEGKEGVRRVDWLMGRTRLVGIVVERSAGHGGSLDGVGGVGKLVFTKE
ncbi:hypothetical protein DFJ43DRAFT_1153441 [Lentinula guzmanii]|uniref:DUF6699 domain-containing protein n=1 Tax=Lentinula guzmanii TaxID=2804957 RepID=A0AA38N163_9AGAR|nr:hypothetical protein DFJ43DRAFT_1153441 [Lentinula guzmanii]